MIFMIFFVTVVAFVLMSFGIDLVRFWHPFGIDFHVFSQSIFFCITKLSVFINNCSKTSSGGLLFFLICLTLFPRGCFRTSIGSLWHPFGNFIVLDIFSIPLWHRKSSLLIPRSVNHLQNNRTHPRQKNCTSPGPRADPCRRYSD